jgi:NitT/TauT family transport system substrate-binding protein
MLKLKWLLILGIPIALLACAPQQASTPVILTPQPNIEKLTIRVGYFPNITHAQALVGIQNGAFQKELGDNVTIDVKTFNAGPTEIEALFAGAIDIGYIGPSPAINGYIKSNGEALRIVSGAASGGSVLVVRRDAKIQSAADLAGKKLATPELGNTQDIAARYYLLQNNLQTTDKGGTVQVLPTKNADTLTLFAKKELDAAWVPEPWGARLVLDERDLWQNRQFVTTNIIVRKQFLDAHPDLVQKWLIAHIQVTRWIQQNPADAKKIVNAAIKRLTNAALREDILDDAWTRLDFTYDPLSASLYASAEHAFALGFLGKTKPDLSHLYDLTLLNQALAEQGLAAVK